MFGVTTPAVQAISKRLEGDFDCLVFHATGTGGRSMESLGDSGYLSGFIDLTTTEVADMLVGGVFAADADRFGAPIRTGSALCRLGRRDGHGQFRTARDRPGAFPQPAAGRPQSERHLMRTTRDENRAIGEWIGSRVNQMEGPVRLLLPLGGVSMLDSPGKAFHDPEADNALFESLERPSARMRGAGSSASTPISTTRNSSPSVVDAFGSIGPRRERRA